jgi:hypothetical protein
MLPMTRNALDEKCHGCDWQSASAFTAHEGRRRRPELDTIERWTARCANLVEPSGLKPKVPALTVRVVDERPACQLPRSRRHAELGYQRRASDRNDFHCDDAMTTQARVTAHAVANGEIDAVT